MGTPKLYIILLTPQPQVSTPQRHSRSVVLLIRSFSECGHFEYIFLWFLLHLHPQLVEKRWPELGCEACQGPCLYLKISRNKLRACSVSGGMCIDVPGDSLLRVCFILPPQLCETRNTVSNSHKSTGPWVYKLLAGNRSLRQFREGYFCNCTRSLGAALDLYCILKLTWSGGSDAGL